VRPAAEHVFIDQCLFEANEAAHGAGIHVQGGGAARVTHSTFTRNVAIGTGGAALVEGGSRLVLENTILWGDSAGAAGAELSVWITGSSLELDSCTLQGGLVAIATWSGGTASGQRLLQQDPSFVAPNGLDGNPSTFADNDYRLAAGSPAVDAGHNLLVAPDRADENGNGDLVELAPFDLAGQDRRRDDPSAPDTGVGVAPIVDHGCHER
jgi:hypothetical protein